MAKQDARIAELDKQIRLAEKNGDLALMNKLRYRRARVMGGIARQQKRAQEVIERRKAVIDRWEVLKPRPGELFEPAVQHEVIKRIAEETGYSADHIREITANRRV
jgi:hypothetical protein